MMRRGRRVYSDKGRTDSDRRRMQCKKLQKKVCMYVSRGP